MKYFVKFGSYQSLKKEIDRSHKVCNCINGDFKSTPEQAKLSLMSPMRITSALFMIHFAYCYCCRYVGAERPLQPLLETYLGSVVLFSGARHYLLRNLVRK